ncbi:hypothetical protein PPNSA23_41630 [Phyllobacterium phragmitis]|uniref:Uncharacterized protein n=1 Tax=Phyllobacterium phragmitis TaxID=2670329 RepID=A0ABQ0H5M6_9HYPH
MTWQSLSQDGSGYGIYQQRYDAAGNSVGDEELVNTYTISDQSMPSVTALDDGGWVVTWQSTGQDGSGYGIYQQRYDASGNAIGEELLVNHQTIGNQDNPSVTALNDGGWLVTWQSSGQDGSGYGVYQQRYDASGNKIGDERQVNTRITGDQSMPSVTALENGGWVVTWQSYGHDGSGWGVFQQQYNSAGDKVGIELRVNLYTLYDQSNPSVTGLSDGGWVVTWQSNVEDGSVYGIYQQRFSADGKRIGPETWVNTYDANEQSRPSVTALDDGGWVVSWQSQVQDGSGFGIYQKRYNADGSPVEPGHAHIDVEDQQANTYTMYDQQYSSITALGDGGWVVTWQSLNQDGSSYGIYQQRYDSNGNTVGIETRVNTYTISEQSKSSVTALGDGGWLVTWQSLSQDGSGYGVYQQRYDANGNTVGDEQLVNTQTLNNQDNPSVTALDDGGWLVTWQSLSQDGSGYGIYQQRYDVTGNKVGNEELVNNYTVNNQQDASVTALNDGGWLVTWQSLGQDGSGYGIYQQRYDSSGAKIEGEKQVNTYTLNDQSMACVTVLDDGGWLITWQSQGQDGSGFGIYQQRYNSSGVKVGDEEQVNTYTLNDQSNPFVTSLADGGWVVAWQSNVEDGSVYGIYQQRYDSNGNKVGPETWVNTYTANDQSAPSITGLESGGWVVSWQSQIQDGSGYGIYQKEYDSNGEPVEPGHTHIAVDDQQVNTYTMNDQSNSSITVLKDGGWIVTWQSQGEDTNGLGIYQQRYDSGGNTVGIETRVNTYIISNQQYTSVTALEDGGWLVTWQSQGQDGSGFGIYQQRYSSGGIAVGEEELVNTYTLNDQSEASVTALTDGGWLVTWQSLSQDGSGYGIYQQRYDISGNKVGDEERVNTQIVNNQDNPSVTALTDGGWLVSWQSLSQDGSGYGIYQQRYDSSGAKIEGEKQVNTYTLNDQSKACVAVLDDGGWLITWQSQGQDGSGFGIYQQRYNSSGAKVGDEEQVNTYTLNDQSNPFVTGLGDGGWVVTWQSNLEDGSGYGIYQQRYDSSGAKVGPETWVNTYTTSDQQLSSVSALDNGGWVVSWQSQGQDGSANGVYQKMYDANGEPVEPGRAHIDVNDQQVNKYTVNDQSYSSITALGDGGWVVTWQSLGQDTSGYGVYQQRYDSAGVKVGIETRVNTYIISDQSRSSVTALDDGGWVVTWQSLSQDGSGYGIYQQRYDSHSVKVGEEELVNTYTLNDQSEASVTALTDGGWLVTWQSNVEDGSSFGIYQQRYNSSGNKVGNEELVNTHTLNSQDNPSVTALADGGWLVSWQSLSQDGSGYGIYQQRYDSSGAKIEGEKQVNTYTLNDQSMACVTVLDDGGWLITWQSQGQDGSGFGIYQQRYNSSGVKVGDEEQVNTYTLNDQSTPFVTGLGDGGWVVTWQSNLEDGSGYGIYQQRYDSSGAKVGSETWVNTYTTSDQQLSSVSALDNGGWVVSWQSQGQDGSGNGVYHKTYDVNGHPVEPGAGANVAALSDDNSPSAAAETSDHGSMRVLLDQSDDGDTSSSHRSTKHDGTDSSHNFAWFGHSDSDTFSLSGSGIHLDLAKLNSSSVANAEVIDITGRGSNSLTLTADDVKDLLDHSGQNELRILADANDKVEAKGFAETGQTATVDHVTYNIYESSDGTHLWVQEDAHVVV